MFNYMKLAEKYTGDSSCSMESSVKSLSMTMTLVLEYDGLQSLNAFTIEDKCWELKFPLWLQHRKLFVHDHIIAILNHERHFLLTL